MKRSVAIVGPTPMFLRWAIEHECPLREIYPDRLAESSFRQLRGIREVSLALNQKRIHSGYCLHPSAIHSTPERLLGFPVEEVVGIFGGQEFVEGQCGSCAANIRTENQSKHWCGCYGGVSADLRIDFEALARGEYQREEGLAVESSSIVENSIEGVMQQPTNRWDLPGLVDQAVSDNHLHGEIEKHFPHSLNSWFALWQAHEFDQEKLRIIERVLGFVIEQVQQQSDSSNCQQSSFGHVALQDLIRFRLAIIHILDSKERIEIELFPSGYSDGRTWQIDPHCKNCRRKWKVRNKPCLECGDRGQYQNEIKLKVLGLRPYVQLAYVIGVEEAEKLIESLRSQFAQ